MNYRTLGRTGIKVSPYCLGAIMFGGIANSDHDECMFDAIFSSWPLRSRIKAMSAGYLSSGFIGSRLPAQCVLVYETT